MSGECPHEHLSAWVDGELTDDERRRVESHLESCEACRRQVQTLRTTKHRLAELGAAREPTDALRRNVERSAEGASESTELAALTNGRTRTRVVALVAAVAAAVAVGYYFGAWQTRRIPAEWADLLVRDHLHSKPAAKPMDVTGEDPQAVVRFFEGKVAFEPIVPTVPGATLVGGRLCKLAGEHVELLFFRHEGEVLSLFVTDELTAPELCRSTNQHAVCIERRGHYRLMLVGRGSRKQLNRLLGRTQI